MLVSDVEVVEQPPPPSSPVELFPLEPDEVAPDDVAPEEVAPEDVAPEEVAPELELLELDVDPPSPDELDVEPPSPELVPPSLGVPQMPWMHEPVRHSGVAVQALPGFLPHALSVSHTPDWQTARPIGAVHVPFRGGVCPASVGIGCPFATSGLQALSPLLHHAFAGQCASVTHATHFFVEGLHAGVAPLQFASAVHSTQMPPCVSSQAGVPPLHAPCVPSSTSGCAGQAPL